jgi:hypothetical protein
MARLLGGRGKCTVAEADGRNRHHSQYFGGHCDLPCQI